SAAWMILGGTIVARTEVSDQHLRDKVQSVWGAPQVQTAPSADYTVLVPMPASAPPSSGLFEQKHAVRPASSDLAVSLSSEPRQKGLLWYATYKVAFRGDYEFQ